MSRTPPLEILKQALTHSGAKNQNPNSALKDILDGDNLDRVLNQINRFDKGLHGFNKDSILKEIFDAFEKQ